MAGEEKAEIRLETGSEQATKEKLARFRKEIQETPEEAGKRMANETMWAALKWIEINDKQEKLILSKDIDTWTEEEIYFMFNKAYSPKTGEKAMDLLNKVRKKQNMAPIGLPLYMPAKQDKVRLLISPYTQEIVRIPREKQWNVKDEKWNTFVVPSSEIMREVIKIAQKIETPQ